MKRPQPDMWNAWVWYADADGRESDLDFVSSHASATEAADAVRHAYAMRRPASLAGSASGAAPLGQIQWGTHGMAHNVEAIREVGGFTTVEGQVLR